MRLVGNYQVVPVTSIISTKIGEAERTNLRKKASTAIAANNHQFASLAFRARDIEGLMSDSEIAVALTAMSVQERPDQNAHPRAHSPFAILHPLACLGPFYTELGVMNIDLASGLRCCADYA